MYEDIIIIDKYYEFFEQLRAEAKDWDLDFRQTRSGNPGNRWVQLSGKNFGFVYAEFNSPYDQRTVAPKGMRTFSILANQRSPSSWCGTPFGWETIVAMPLTNEFSAISTGYFSNYVFTLSEDLLASTAELQFHMDWDKLAPHLSGASYELSSSDIFTLRKALRGLALSATNAPSQIQHQIVIAEIASAVVRGLINFQQLTDNSKPRNRELYLRKAQNYIDDNIQESVSMTELCKASGVSERTLEYTFKEYFDLSPKRFIVAQRLAKVRQMLVESDARSSRVRDIAGEYDFWHMGQFARDYRKVYGENPSETLDRQF